MKYNAALKCTVKIHLMPNSAEFQNYILILIMMLSNMLKEHTVKTVFMNKVGKELNKYDDTIVVTLHNTEELFRIMYIKLAPMLNKLKKWSSFVSINFAEANEKYDEIYYKTEMIKSSLVSFYNYLLCQNLLLN